MKVNVDWFKVLKALWIGLELILIACIAFTVFTMLFM